MTRNKRPENFRTLIKAALEDFPTALEVACDILNDDIKLPPENPGESANVPRPLLRAPAWGRRFDLVDRAIIEEAGLTLPPERPKTQREMEKEKEREWYRHHPTDEDMNAARAAVASLLRYLLPPPRGVPASYKRGSQKPDCFANYALPGVAKWPPRLGDAELIAAMKVMAPERTRVVRLVAGRDQWAVAYMIRLLAVGRDRRPRRLWEYYRCLVAAFTLGGWEGVDRELRPCLACPRFFVARSAKRLTCSDACRQRYSRYTREDWEEALERDRRRKATSPKCSLSSEACASAKHPPASPTDPASARRVPGRVSKVWRHSPLTAPVLVEVHSELRQECAQVIQATDEHYPRQPFPLQCPDETLCHRDGAMLAHHAEALFDIPWAAGMPSLPGVPTIHQGMPSEQGWGGPTAK